MPPPHRRDALSPRWTDRIAEPAKAADPPAPAQRGTQVLSSDDDPARARGGDDPRGHPGRILVVDDEPQVLRVVSRYLERQGFETKGASDGAMALELVASRNFDAVLSDISMPGLSGLELLRVVRERDPDLPVILMTALPAIESAARAVEYGALRYLTKPLDLNALIEAVHYGVRLRRMALLNREALAVSQAAERARQDRVEASARLTRGLERLWMAYQPIISWSRQAVVAYEALVRSDEPTMATPDLLFAAARQLDRLPDVGRAVRASVASFVAGMSPDLEVFVNVHPAELMDDDLFSPDQPFTRHAARVVLEITERASLESMSDTRSRIKRLKALGFRIAVDDLGAGYAGLTSLVALQPDIVKFDMDLVRDIDTDSTKQRLIGTMITLCQDMGVRAVAEGIETPAERDTLAALGCDLMQGYLFARPARTALTPVFGL